MATEQGCFCHQCGQPLAPASRFCGGCGAGKLGVATSGETTKSKTSTAGGWHSIPKQTRSMIVSCLIGVILLGWIVWLSVPGQNKNVPQAQPQTVQQFLQTERVKLLEELKQTTSDFATHIENIHATVSYKGGTVKSMTATTVDGSNMAGPDGSNITEMDIVVTAYWEGKVQKSGFTELRLVYDPHADKLKRVEYLDSNALFNARTVDWMKVGYTLAALMAGM